jgi:hypothetical protein
VSAQTWLRIAAAVLAVHTIAHSAGSVGSNNRTLGVGVLSTTMQNFHFSIMGTDRTVWDFFHGPSLLSAANLAILTVLSRQAGDLCVPIPPERGRSCSR